MNAQQSTMAISSVGPSSTLEVFLGSPGAAPPNRNWGPPRERLDFFAPSIYGPTRLDQLPAPAEKGMLGMLRPSKGFSTGVSGFIWRGSIEVPSRVKFGIVPRAFEVLVCPCSVREPIPKPYNSDRDGMS